MSFETVGGLQSVNDLRSVKYLIFAVLVISKEDIEQRS